MNVYLSCLASFVLSLAIDFVYAKWQAYMNADRVAGAMAYSAMCPVIGYFSFFAWFDHGIAIIPSSIGCALGTLLAMRWHKWTQRLKA